MIIKKALSYFVKRTALIVVFVLTAIVCYLQCALLFSNITINSSHEEGTIPIYILSNGVHTDIVVPTTNEHFDWSAYVLRSNTSANDREYKWTAFGWGDKGFYLETPTWADLKASTALRACSGIGETAMHCTLYTRMSSSDNCIKVLVDANDYSKLCEYIYNSFDHTENGELIFIETDAVYGTTDAFYEANGSYSLFKTCNTWANDALKSSNQKCCLWTPFDKGILSRYRKD